jgi:heme-degrading monooxygenase HmoA
VFARVSTIQGSPENIDEAIAQYREALSQFRDIAGNKGAFLLVDRDTGKAIGMTIWDSEQSMSDSREQATQLRERATDEARSQIQSVEEYEVAVSEPGA